MYKKHGSKFHIPIVPALISLDIIKDTFEVYLMQYTIPVR